MKTLKLLLILALTSIFVDVHGQATQKMYAHVIDVGQGLSVLLEFPQGAVLIDAGAAPDHEIALVDYLKKFFQRRTDLNHTLNGVMITHQHIDHDIALDDLTRNFKILNYLDNGRRRVTTTEVNQIWMQDNYIRFGCRYEAITFDKAAAVPGHKGFTDDVIDPVSGVIDPKIVIYSGAFVTKPNGWTQDDYDDPNNNSMVIKVTFGSASFLFSGDLEETGIQQVLDLYAGTDALRADVMQVGHHGSRNAITTQWISAIKPKYAFISCGHWDDGRLPNGRPKTFTTYAYAHPHVESIKILEDSLTITRPESFTVNVGTKGSYQGSIPKFTTKSIHKTYATPWDGTMIITATSTGQYTFTTHQ